jgi:hypothetical protein
VPDALQSLGGATLGSMVNVLRFPDVVADHLSGVGFAAPAPASMAEASPAEAVQLAFAGDDLGDLAAGLSQAGPLRLRAGREEDFGLWAAGYASFGEQDGDRRAPASASITRWARTPLGAWPSAMPTAGSPTTTATTKSWKGCGRHSMAPTGYRLPAASLRSRPRPAALTPTTTASGCCASARSTARPRARPRPGATGATSACGTPANWRGAWSFRHRPRSGPCTRRWTDLPRPGPERPT